MCRGIILLFTYSFEWIESDLKKKKSFAVLFIFAGIQVSFKSTKFQKKKKKEIFDNNKITSNNVMVNLDKLPSSTSIGGSEQGAAI